MAMQMIAAEFLEIDPKVRIWLAILCGISLAILVLVVLHPPRYVVGYNFQAFWCGARVLFEHSNPYLNEPLHACEASHSPDFFVRYPNMTIPAPLPGYALVLFMSLAWLPYTVARAIWCLILVASTVTIGNNISKLSSMPLITAFAASGLAVGGSALVFGSLAPLPIALTVFAALELRKKRWNRAALFLGFAMIEPHMVLPACATVFLFVGPMRVPLLFAGAVASAVMLVALGPHVAMTYFTNVLPAHAASEVNMLDQTSLTVLLYQLGVTAQTALRIGLIQYLILCVGGVYLARQLTLQAGDRAWLVLVPSAFAVVGGSYIHLEEIAMAIPLASLLLMRRPTVAASLALLLLAVPAELVLNWVFWAPAAALVCGWFMARSKKKPPLLLSAKWAPIVAVGLAIMMIPLMFGAAGGFGAAAPALPPMHLAAAAPSDLASNTWGEMNFFSVRPHGWWLEKTLTLVPLGIVVWCCFQAATHKTTWPPLEPIP